MSVRGRQRPGLTTRPSPVPAPTAASRPGDSELRKGQRGCREPPVASGFSVTARAHVSADKLGGAGLCVWHTIA